jgi:hypothetical protein
MGQAELNVRIPTNIRARLNCRAEYQGTSMNAEVIDVLKTMMTAEPPYIVVRTYITRTEHLYTAAMNESSDDFYSGGTFGGVIKAAQAKIKELGFNQREVRIERRVEQIVAPAYTEDARHGSRNARASE